MLENLIRVSPPQGALGESHQVLSDKKSFNGDHRNELDTQSSFKTVLNHSLIKSKHEKSQNSDQKKTNDEQIANKESDRSSGVIKKKMSMSNSDKSKKLKRLNEDDDDSAPNVKKLKTEISSDYVDLKERKVTEQFEVSPVMDSKESDNETAAVDKSEPVQTLTTSFNSDQSYLNETEKALLAESQIAIQAEGTTDSEAIPQAMVNSELSAQVNPELSTQVNSELAAQVNSELAAQVNSESVMSNSMTVVPQMNVEAGQLSEEVKPRLISSEIEKLTSENQIQQSFDSSNGLRLETSEDSGPEFELGSQSSSHSENQSQEKNFSEQNSPPVHFEHDLSAQIAALQTDKASFSRSESAPAASQGLMMNEKIDSSSDDQSNVKQIKQIMSQAKFLVNQGGGEMTVKMTPEGLGEVHLRVLLNDGKINIEMNSNDKSVKKLIEDSLSELKSSLASHQLQVEHVKINQVLAVESSSQSQMDTRSNDSNGQSSKDYLNHHKGESSNFSSQSNHSGSDDKKRTFTETVSLRSNGEALKSYDSKSTNLRTLNSRIGQKAYLNQNKGSSLNVSA